MQISKILFPTDFSDVSKRALSYAVFLQRMFNAQLEIAHVIFDETYLVTSYVPQGTLQGFFSELEQGAEQHLTEFLAECEVLKGVAYNIKLLKGSPYAEIIRWAKESNADIIVIGTHGRTGLDHVLFGSTAEKVIGRAPCPVLTIN
jgi:nucleotide-binding universal stress UspA family protein